MRSKKILVFLLLGAIFLAISLYIFPESSSTKTNTIAIACGILGVALAFYIDKRLKKGDS